MAINIQNVTLKISAGEPRQILGDPTPQIAFSGRSNVGKSSLINSLLNRKSLARVSSAPGKTITINFYDVDKKLYLVDLPGYGYAKRSKDSQKVWSTLTEDFFVKNPSLDALKLVVQLIDIRTGPTDDDIMMINFLIDNGVNFVVVATKTDKLSKTQLKNAIAIQRGGAKWVRECEGCSVYWRTRIAHAFQEKDVAKREELIDKIWWDAAEELTDLTSPLGPGALATYAVRLKIALKRAKISIDAGNTVFDKLTAETKISF
jgi:GTP-binding protein